MNSWTSENPWPHLSAWESRFNLVLRWFEALDWRQWVYIALCFLCLVILKEMWKDIRKVG